MEKAACRRDLSRFPISIIRESAALAAVLLPGLGGLVIGSAVAVNSFFEMGIIDYFIAQARESICLRPDFLKWDSEKVEFSNPVQ